MACEPVAQGGGLVLAGRSELTSVSYLSVVDDEQKRVLTVYATAPVKLYQLGEVVDRVANVAVVIGTAGESPATLVIDPPADSVVLHLNDANAPRIKVNLGDTVWPSSKGWRRMKNVMAARGPDRELLVVARVSPNFKGIQVCRHGNDVHVEPQGEPSGPALPIYNAEGSVVGVIVSARIRLPTAQAVGIIVGAERIEIPTDQAPDNFVPDLQYGLRVLQLPPQ